MNWLRRTVASIVFLACSLGVCWASNLDYARLAQALDAAKSNAQVKQILDRFDVAGKGDSTLSELAVRIGGQPVPSETLVQTIRDHVALRAMATGQGKLPPVNVERLQQVKDTPLYHDPGPMQSSNWIESALESLRDWWSNLFRTPQPAESAPGPSFGGDFSWMVPLAWIVLGIALLATIIYVGNAIIANRSKKALRSKGIITDEEAKLTIDEWLAKADSLIAAGQHREAVRCLYVACLMRLHQAGRIEFNRFDTNWEHVQRYQIHPLANQFNLQTPTREFDSIWYGERIRGIEDAERFRAYYSDLTRALREKVSA